MQSIPLRFFAGLALLLTVTKANAAEEYSLRDGTLWNGSRPVLQKVPSGFAIVADPTGAGVFLRMTVGEAGSFIQSPLGVIAGLQRFTSCHRDEPWWMVPAAGRAHSDVKLETQWLLAETAARGRDGRQAGRVPTRCRERSPFGHPARRRHANRRLALVME